MIEERVLVAKLDDLLKSMGLYEEDEEGQNSLLENIDSLMFIQLIIGIESRYGIGIPDELLLAKNFADKRSIVRILEELCNEEEQGGICKN